MTNVFGELKATVGLSKKETAVSPQQEGKKILIVEDEVQLIDALEILFASEGFTVMRAGNGEIGLQKAIEFVPDVILLDLLMPVMGGKQMLAKLREIPQFKTTPVIILSNVGTIENIREMTTFYNVKHFLIKANTSMDEIVQNVRMSLSAHKKSLFDDK